MYLTYKEGITKVARSLPSFPRHPSVGTKHSEASTLALEARNRLTFLGGGPSPDPPPEDLDLRMNPPRGGIPGPGAGPGALVGANEGDGADNAAEGATQGRELLISDAIRRRRGLLEWSRACRAAAEGRLAAAGRSSGAVGETPANPDDEARAFRSMAAEAEGAWTTRGTRGGRVDYGAMLRDGSGDHGDEEFVTGDRSAAEDYLSDDAGTCSADDDDKSESSEESEGEYHDGSRKRRRYCFRKRARKKRTQWEQMIQELAQFKREHGHCNVKQRRSDNKDLAAFVKKMREYKRCIDRGESKGARILTPRRIMHLNLMGFVWNMRPDWGQKTFDGHLNDLQSFKDRHGHCDVPRVLKEDMALARWCHMIRQSYKAIGRGENPAYKLSEEQIERLVAMGFRLKVKERGKITMKSFEQRIEDMKAYKRVHGHLRVMPMMDRALSAFCSQLRGARRHPDRTNALKLTDARIAALDSIGFLWEVDCRVPVRQRIQELKEYKEQHGDSPISSRNKSLAKLCRDLRRARREPETSKIKLDDRDIVELDLIGFDWDPPKFSSDSTKLNSRKRISKQVACGECEGCKREACEECGACNASPKKRCVRRLCSKSHEKVPNLCFSWTGGTKTQRAFSDRLDELRAFKEEHGHLAVRIHHNKSLANFCTRIRGARRNKGDLKLTDNQVNSLNEIGFLWELGKKSGGKGSSKRNAVRPRTPRKSFSDRLEELRAFKEEHGHLAVGMPNNKSLANFCSKIRGARKNVGSLKLTDDQVTSLNDIGFLWELKRDPKMETPNKKRTRISFEDRIQNLKKFRAAHGHLLVSRKEDASLADFCSNVRYARNNPGAGWITLTETRISLLDSIGFPWGERHKAGDIREDNLADDNVTFLEGDMKSPNRNGELVI
ncbi:hypothetical protein ACHAWF_016242 [Thalassiosira exigua]